MILTHITRNTRSYHTHARTRIFGDHLCSNTGTATPIKHEMWLISLENLLSLYGEGSRMRVMEVHQDLKRREFLMPWCDVPADAEIIFVRILCARSLN